MDVSHKKIILISVSLTPTDLTILNDKKSID